MTSSDSDADVVIGPLVSDEADDVDDEHDWPVELQLQIEAASELLNTTSMVSVVQLWRTFESRHPHTRCEM